MRIGIFDSGVGGITVLKELRRTHPAADFVYLGDTAHVPYGTKSPAQVERLSAECAVLLKTRGVDALVVACNTASAVALPAIRRVMGKVPVFGVVEPGVRAVLAASSGSSPMLILATRATVRSGEYGRLIRLEVPGARVTEQACPLLVPMIEEGWVDHPILHMTIREYVGPHLGVTGVALLACTHYPWIQSAFERALPGWTVVDSAHAVARAFGDASGPAQGRLGTVEWIFTDPDAVPAFARRWMEGTAADDAAAETGFARRSHV